jgi:threonylcarbamoyladenosine tRNA methylthiotransferase MtaB
MAQKVSFNTLGCRLNIAETGSLASGFTDRGYEVVDFAEKADVVFINTCTVTDKADSTCRNLIRKAQRTSPQGKVIVAGCLSQMEPEAVAAMEGVDLVLGNTEKFKVFDYLDGEIKDEDKIKVNLTTEFWGASTTPEEGHTRAFLKIQDGCNYICSFCIIPFARGRSRTISISDAVIEAQVLVRRGFQEIVLTGVNIGEYESKSGEKLSELIQKVASVEGVKRLRLSSVEPNTITTELLEVLVKTPEFLPHFHLPLQSGDDNILSQMRRKYTVEDYRAIHRRIKSFFPEAVFGGDIILGFPGETEEMYQNTYNLVKELNMGHIHVFPYSKRAGTTAIKLPNHIDPQVKKKRVKEMIDLGEEILRAQELLMVGSVDEVLFERRNSRGNFEGYTKNFMRVELETNLEMKNIIEKVLIVDRADKLIVNLLS